MAYKKLTLSNFSRKWNTQSHVIFATKNFALINSDNILLWLNKYVKTSIWLESARILSQCTFCSKNGNIWAWQTAKSSEGELTDWDFPPSEVRINYLPVMLTPFTNTFAKPSTPATVPSFFKFPGSVIYSGLLILKTK